MLTLAPTNAALVKQVLRGRRERFDVLVRRHLNAVYAVAYSFTTNHADAEDVAQDAFLKAYTSLDTLREPAKFEGWLIAIVRNSALRAVKKHQRDKEREKEAQVPAADRAADPARDELYGLLGEKMQALEEPQREVLMLHYFAGKRTREIARLLDISQAAVLKRLQRAREALGGKMIEEIVGSRTQTDWANARSKEIGKLVLAATAGWTATQTAGGVAFASALLSGRALAIGVAGVSGAALIVAIATLSDPQPGPKPTDAVVVAADTSDEEAQEPEEPPESPPEAEPEPDTAPDEREPEINEEEPAPKPVELPSEPVETAKTYMASILQSPVSMTFEDIYLWHILEFIGAQYEVRILIDAGAVYIPDASQATGDGNTKEREYFSDGIFESIDITDMTLFEMLDHICNASGLSYISEPGFIWISSPSLIAAEVRREPDARFDSYENEENALKKGSIVFDDIHIRDVLEFIGQQHHVNLMIDYRVIQPNEKPSLPRPHEIPQGYASDGWVAYTSAKNIELRDCLKVLLRPLNLSYAVRDNAIVISSADRLAQSDPLKESLMTPGEMDNKMKAYRTAMTAIQPSAPQVPPEPEQESEPVKTITLLHLQETTSGARAQFESMMGRRWYREGNAFGPFRLLAIDLKSGCCTILDEELGEEFELCMPQDE